MSITLALAAAIGAACPAAQPGRVLYQDRFDGPPVQWVMEHRAGPASVVKTEGGKLVMDVNGGATAWFRQPLSGNYRITFRRTVMDAGGHNDRVSDFNMFWMARDPANANLFTRSGKFEDYDSVRMYYVGIGGNSNTTARLRRYDGKGEKRLLGEYLDAVHLLKSNHSYAVAISVLDGCTSVSLDGETIFNYRDPEPLRNGYFGFRTTQSRQEIDDFKVVRLRRLGR